MPMRWLCVVHQFAAEMELSDQVLVNRTVIMKGTFGHAGTVTRCMHLI